MAAKTSDVKVTLPSDLEIKITRTFDAPRDLVFEACSNPEYVKQWWGPKGTTLPVCEIDFRVGGKWHFVERAQDGSEHPFKGEYREIVVPEKVVQTFIYDVAPFSDMQALETAVFTEKNGATTITTTVRHDTKEARDGHLQSGMEQGMTETYERLAELLAKLA